MTVKICPQVYQVGGANLSHPDDLLDRKKLLPVIKDLNALVIQSRIGLLFQRT